MNFCLHCGTAVPADALRCPACGTDVEPGPDHLGPPEEKIDAVPRVPVVSSGASGGRVATPASPASSASPVAPISSAPVAAEERTIVRPKLVEPHAPPVVSVPPETGDGHRRRRRRWPVPVGVAVVVVVVIAVVAAVLVLTTPDATTVRLESVDTETAPESFSTFDGGAAPGAVGALQASPTFAWKATSGSGLALQPAYGDTAGLYATLDGSTAPSGSGSGADTNGAVGAAGDGTICDISVLRRGLVHDAARTRVWVERIGLGTTWNSTVSKLVPILLGQDTAVTEYQYESGKAVPHQAILEAGTAVLIDRRAQPQVVCATGNPLGPPTIGVAGSKNGKVVLKGTKWPQFREQRVVSIEPSPSKELTRLDAVYSIQSGQLLTTELTSATG